MKYPAEIRPGLRSRSRQRGDEERHGPDCTCEKHQRAERLPNAKERDQRPERQKLPFLSVWVDDMAATAVGLSRASSVVVEVTNKGNAPSITPIVELYLQQSADLLWRGGMAQLPAVYPHSTVAGAVDWSWDLEPIGATPHLSLTAAERFPMAHYLTVICYDPSLDPKPPRPFDSAGQPLHHLKVLDFHHWAVLDAGGWSP